MLRDKAIDILGQVTFPKHKMEHSNQLKLAA